MTHSEQNWIDDESYGSKDVNSWHILYHYSADKPMNPKSHYISILISIIFSDRTAEGAFFLRWEIIDEEYFNFGYFFPHYFGLSQIKINFRMYCIAFQNEIYMK